jgi:hypothetical protein
MRDLRSLALASFIASASCFVLSGQCTCGEVVRTSVSNLLLEGKPELPTIPMQRNRSISDLPSVLALTIGTSGIVCSLAIIRTPEPDLAQAVKERIQKWRFHPVHRDDTHSPVCISSKIFVYAAITDKHIVWDIPGVSQFSKIK